MSGESFKLFVTEYTKNAIKIECRLTRCNPNQSEITLQAQLQST